MISKTFEPAQSTWFFQFKQNLIYVDEVSNASMPHVRKCAVVHNVCDKFETKTIRVSLLFWKHWNTEDRLQFFKLIIFYSKKRLLEDDPQQIRQFGPVCKLGTARNMFQINIFKIF